MIQNNIFYPVREPLFSAGFYFNIRPMMIRKQYFFGAILLVTTAYFLAILFLPHAAPRFVYSIPGLNKTLPYVKIDNTEIPVEIARDAASVKKGLSGRDYLDADSGMLFVFSKPDQYRFWMPNMNFPLDIIWIVNGRVAGVSKNISPEVNMAKPKFYTPLKPVLYVLEVNAGFADKNNIAIGDAAAVFNIK